MIIWLLFLIIYRSLLRRSKHIKVWNNKIMIKCFVNEIQRSRSTKIIAQKKNNRKMCEKCYALCFSPSFVFLQFFGGCSPISVFFFIVSPLFALAAFMTSSLRLAHALVLSLLAFVQKYKYWHLRSCLSFNATWTSSKWCVVCYWKREEVRVELPNFVLYGCLARILDISQNWGDNPQWWGHDGRGVTVQS